MKPIAIFRHSPTEGPGYLATWLDRAAMRWELKRLDAGDAVPDDPGRYSGIAFMGGPMSVNEDLPWIPPVLALIREAVARDVPVLGHCLGGQLMSKALGGEVVRAPLKEIGWGEVTLAQTPRAHDWFGTERDTFVTFQWHGETFSIPPGAERVLSGRWCENQAFALGPHVGLQCHIEMTEALVQSWCATGRREIEHSASPAVQTVEQILDSLAERVQALHAVADAVYSRWAMGSGLMGSGL